MSKNANQIVASLLEYGGTWGGDAEERPGSPGDAWRKGGFQKFDASTMDVSGRRPGEPLDAAPELSDDERAKLDAQNAARSKDKMQRQPGRTALPGNRFQWKPPEA